MKQGTIKYSQEFISPTGLKRWIGMEYPLDWETDDPQFILNYLKNMVEAGYNALNPTELSAPGQQGPPAELPVINRSEQRLIDLMEDAKNTGELFQYYDDCKSNTLMTAYLTIRERLVAKELSKNFDSNNKK